MVVEIDDYCKIKKKGTSVQIYAQDETIVSSQLFIYINMVYLQHKYEKYKITRLLVGNAM